MWPVWFACLHSLDLRIFLVVVAFQYYSEFSTVLLQTRYETLIFMPDLKGLVWSIERRNDCFPFDEVAFSGFDKLQNFSNVFSGNVVEDFAERQRLDSLNCILRNIGCDCINQGSKKLFTILWIFMLEVAALCLWLHPTRAESLRSRCFMTAFEGEII